MTNAPGITLRIASNEDTERIRAVIAAVRNEYGVQCPPGDEADADLVDLEDSYPRRGGVFKVLERADGVMIGVVALYPRRACVCELRKMYLLAEERGHGFGRLMMEEALADVRRLGFRRIELETNSLLQTAIGLYTRYGFRPYVAPHLTSKCDCAFALDLERPADD